MGGPTPDPRRRADAVARNHAPIRDCLARWLPDMGLPDMGLPDGRLPDGGLPQRGLVLEVASGSGEHAVHFAAAFPGLVFQPSDPQAAARASIDAWAAASGLANLRPALHLDAAATEWPVAHAAAILCINMVHISPWAATLGLLRAAGRILDPGGILYLYGPYRQAGVPTAPSNEAFHASLKARDPAWGLRDLEAVVAAAAAEGLALAATEPMPANNLSVIFRR